MPSQEPAGRAGAAPPPNADERLDDTGLHTEVLLAFSIGARRRFPGALVQVSEARRPCRQPPLEVASVRPSQHALPPHSGAATFRTAYQHASSRAPLSPRVHESDETTVRPVRGEVSRAPARVPECTTQQESCQLLHTHVISSPRQCGARRDARDARVLPYPRADCG
jgi:hypothetical protein